MIKVWKRQTGCRLQAKVKFSKYTSKKGNTSALRLSISFSCASVVYHERSEQRRWIVYRWIFFICGSCSFRLSWNQKIVEIWKLKVLYLKSMEWFFLNEYCCQDEFLSKIVILNMFLKPSTCRRRPTCSRKLLDILIFIYALVRVAFE